MKMDGEDLLEAALQGQPWAAHAIVTVYAPVMLGYARVAVPNRNDTDYEEAVERAITRAVERLEHYDSTRASFGTWLRPFVRHALADIRRERGVTEPLPDDLVAPPTTTDHEPPEAQAIRNAITRLSDTDQLIIALRDYEQLSYEECAERIGGVNAAACRVRHHRAIRRLFELARHEPALAAYLEVDVQ
jgi:RNA polymerase sigma-70 factor (ECF subfamily)